MVVITDEEFEEVAPEMTRDIELRRFVPLEHIPPIYFNRPYYLAPAGRSVKAYHLLAETMERTGRVGIGSFVMRGHEHLVAIISENGVLRAETLRYADEIRTPEYVGLPKRARVPAKKVTELAKEIDGLTRDSLDMTELEDRDAQALQALAQEKEKRGEDVISISGLEEEAPEGGGAQIIDLMQLLRKSLSKNAVVNTAQEASEPIPFPRQNKRAKSQQRANGGGNGKPRRGTAKRSSPARTGRRTTRSRRTSTS
jgi:DNA end-binding protein Ku